jgi:hypothetical protein
VSQDQAGRSVSIAKLTLIVELKHVALRVECSRAILVHDQMSESLVGEENRVERAGRKSLRGKRPIEGREKQQHTSVHRIAALVVVVQ